MKTNHIQKHGSEVEAEGPDLYYNKWQIRANGVTNDINKEELLEILTGNNVNLSLVNKKLTISVLSVNKITKEINDPTYTLLESDKDKWLVFKVNCNVTIPQGISANIIVEGEAYTGATVTFQAASGLSLRHVDSISKILSPNGVFGVRYKSTTDTILYGTDPTNYLNQ